ncbi:MAG: DNA repair protein RecN [Candidatus Puniceispirillaceae bacterium]
MLAHLRIRNIVLIDALALDFDDGLMVLTGETGAGKSILLDALGLALGSRADFNLIRQGTERAEVSAAFEVASDHPVWDVLDQAGLPQADELILRRQLRGDGRSLAFINDAPVSVGTLREAGDMLVEIQGQFEGRGLLDSAAHITLLDRAAGQSAEAQKMAHLWQIWQETSRKLQEMRDHLSKAQMEEDWLRDAVMQLDNLAPMPGEEESLVNERALHANAGRIAEALQEALALISDEAGLEALNSRALNTLEKIADLAGETISPALEALVRTSTELSEARAIIQSAGEQLDGDPMRLQAIDERLYELRAQARKHQCTTDALTAMHQRMSEQLAAMDNSTDILAELASTAETARQDYLQLAEAISTKRHAVASQLDSQVMAELPPLKLENAVFTTAIQRLDESRWGPQGMEKVRFEASTNPGQATGPIDRIASGGELARFLLALKVALAASENTKTLIFDEVDSGVGGAVAAAVGSRLGKLGTAMQTLVITHSPQVAARGNAHLKIAKSVMDDKVVSVTRPLTEHERTDEIARMLSGEIITPEARAAAVRLIHGH